MKKQVGFLGIDTSNYTTSGAVCDANGNILANVRILLPVAEGERGLRQSDAVFAHIKNLPTVFEQLKSILQEIEILGIGCSEQPRNEQGSYMPCFLSGVAVATALGSCLNVPVQFYSHQEGHVMAALASAGVADEILKAPFLAFHVSGGTTDLLKITPSEESSRLQIECLGTSKDLHAGQAIDRIGVLMGLNFPCGKALEALAKENTFPVPIPKISVSDGDCHFSGLENLAAKLWKETGNQNLVSAFVLEFCAKTLEKMTAWASKENQNLPIIYAGGVMSNQFLQKRLSKRKNTYFAKPEFSADNASGIALLCKRAFDLNRK